MTQRNKTTRRARKLITPLARRAQFPKI